MCRKLPDHLFISQQGDLYDTRILDWNRKPPLRDVYSRPHTKIMCAEDLKSALRYGASTEIGGYPLYFVMSDRQPLSFKSARKNLREVLEAQISRPSRHWLGDEHAEWLIVGVEINWEDTDLVCCHSGERIPSAYGNGNGHGEEHEDTNQG